MCACVLLCCLVVVVVAVVVVVLFQSVTATCTGLDKGAAERKWQSAFTDPTVRRDKVMALNREGIEIGEAPE